MYKHLLLTLFSFFLFLKTSTAQSIKFEHLSLEDGLSQSGITAILQDSRGMLWFGTQDGLNQYNGYTFKVFRHHPKDENSLSNNSVLSLFEDSQGYLWIGTEGGGLDRFDYKKQQFTNFHHEERKPHSLSHDIVRCIFEDQAKNLWIGTELGLDKLRFEEGQAIFTDYFYDPDAANTLSNNHINTIFQDSQERLWVGTRRGLNLLTLEGDKIDFQIFRAGNGQQSGLKNDAITAIYEDDKNRIWVGTDGGGLHLYQPSNQTFRSFLHPKSNSPSSHFIKSIAQDGLGRLWLGTDGGGLQLFDTERKVFNDYFHDALKSESVAHNSIWSLYRDKTGILWVGTHGNGISKLDVKHDKFLHFLNESKGAQRLSNNIHSIFEDEKGHLWLGTDDGISILDRETKTYRYLKTLSNRPNSLSHHIVHRIYEDKQKRLWVGTKHGLNLLDKNTQTFTRFMSDKTSLKSLSENDIRAIWQDEQGTLWVGTANGLNRWNEEENTFKRYFHFPNKKTSLAHNFVRTIYQDSKNRLWIGTKNGLSRYDRQTDGFTNYLVDVADSSSLSHPEVWAVLEDSKGRIWVGTHGGGLNLLDVETGKFQHFREKDGLPNDMLHDLAEDENGNLWFGTHKGMTKFDTQTQSFQHYDTRDGVQSNEFNLGAHFKSASGELFFGGINGFNAFFPAQVQDNPDPPQVVLTEFYLFNKAVKIGGKSPLSQHISHTEEIKLSHKESFFDFEFAALNFTHTEKNQYAYKLENFDADWNYIGTRRRATYTNLDAGTYIFRVKASNNDGKWNETGAAVRIVITPPFWEEPWFLVLLVLSLLLATFGFSRWRMARINRQKRILEAKVNQRTQEVVASREEVLRQAESLKQASNEIQRKNKDITDSINYAKRIQKAMLPRSEELKNLLPESFIFFKPRDIVSGDFYWFMKTTPNPSLRLDPALALRNTDDWGTYQMTDPNPEAHQKIVVAAIDCTGHGIPGAFMSLIGNEILHEIVDTQGISEPDLILSGLHKGVSKALQQEKTANQDGMDMALCVLDLNENKLEYAGAKNPLIFIQNNTLTEIKADKLPIGGISQGKNQDKERRFKKHSIPLDQPTWFYIYSDGFQDQFGGELGKKFMKKRFKNLLLEMHQLPMHQQKAHLQQTLNEWTQNGKHAQVDDILVIGFQLSVSSK